MIGVSLKVSKTISKNLPFKSFQKPDHAPDADDLDECFSRGSGNFVVLGEPAWFSQAKTLFTIQCLGQYRADALLTALDHLHVPAQHA